MTNQRDLKERSRQMRSASQLNLVPSWERSSLTVSCRRETHRCAEPLRVRTKRSGWNHERPLTAGGLVRHNEQNVLRGTRHGKGLVRRDLGRFRCLPLFFAQGGVELLLLAAFELSVVVIGIGRYDGTALPFAAIMGEAELLHGNVH